MEQRSSWLKAGYETFALHGPQALKVEPLAKQVGSSKSSFYHYFSDLSNFMDELLADHLRQCHLLGEKERQIQRIFPDLIEVLWEHRLDLLFNRQLRIHQHQTHFKAVLNQGNQAVGDSFVLIWVKDLNLSLKPGQLAAIFELALENFFLQLNPNHLNKAWLNAYFLRLKQLTQQFV